MAGVDTRGGRTLWAVRFPARLRPILAGKPAHFFQMETRSAQPPPDLQILVQQVNESSAEKPGGGSVNQTTPEFLAGITDEVHRMSTPERDGHRFDAMWRIRGVIDSLHRIPTSRDCYLEKDLGAIHRQQYRLAMRPRCH
jgi:hypothetical protein